MNKIFFRSLVVFLGVTVLSLVLPPIGYLAGIGLLIFGVASYIRKKMSHTTTIQVPPQLCPNCAKSQPRKSKFCTYCGTKLEPATERDRTVTPVLAGPKSTVPCPNCGRNISHALKFCTYCGKKVEGATGSQTEPDKAVCTNCGRPLPRKNAKYCTSCGARQGATSRKQKLRG